MFTIPQLAELLGVSELHVRNLINQGQLEYVDLSLNKSGRAIRITQDQLDRFIEDRTSIRSRCLSPRNGVEAVA